MIPDHMEREEVQEMLRTIALRQFAAHNHLSGGLSPNKDDIEITAQRKKAGEAPAFASLATLFSITMGNDSFREKGDW